MAKVLITYCGETKTVKEWSSITGIPVSTIHGRMYKNFPVDQLFKPCLRGKLIPYMRDLKSLSDWAREYGIPPRTVHNRLHDGWTFKQALETPVNRSAVEYRPAIVKNVNIDLKTLRDKLYRIKRYLQYVSPDYFNLPDPHAAHDSTMRVA